MKVAISLPDPLFAAAERLAERRKVSRSKLYAEALAEYLGSWGASEITAKLDAVYGAESSALDPEIRLAQRRAIGDETW